MFHGEKGKGQFSFEEAVKERDLNRKVTKAVQGLSGAGLASSDEVPADRFRRQHVDRKLREEDQQARHGNWR